METVGVEGGGLGGEGSAAAPSMWSAHPSGRRGQVRARVQPSLKCRSPLQNPGSTLLMSFGTQLKSDPVVFSGSFFHCSRQQEDHSSTPFSFV